MFWPPEMGKEFPDLELIDQTGKKVRISDFKGSVILIEYIGMTCPACQAFSGAHDVGAYGGIKPQKGLKSIEKFCPIYSKGVRLSDDRVIFIQILLYSMSMGAPTVEDAKKWAKHFRLDRSKNQIVLAGKEELLGKASYDLIPGFQLVDKDFILRSDSTGHHPRNNLYTELLPMMPELIK